MRPRTIVWIGVGLTLWALSVVWSLVDSRQSLLAAKDEVDDLRSLGSDGLDARAVSDALRSIDGHLSTARDRSDSPVLLPLRPLPVLGRHLAVLRSLSESSAGVSGRGVRVLDVLESFGDPEPDSSGDVSRAESLQTVESEVAALREALQGFDVGPRNNLLAPFVEAQAEVEEGVAELTGPVDELYDVVRGLASFLGEADYVLLGANNAEMRLGSGMVLSVGELTASDGHVEISELLPSEGLFPVPTRAPSGPQALDIDVQRNWGFLQPTNDYRKLTYTARFADFTGPQAVAMWEAQTGRSMDGALLIDPFVIDAVLGVTGPLTIDGDVFSSGMALEYLLIDQYRIFDGDASQIAERRDRLSVIAGAVADELARGQVDALELIMVLRPLIEGRHLLVYGSDPIEQAAWSRLGATGELDGDETGAYLLNSGGSKLDPYIQMAVDVTVEPVSGGSKLVRYRTTLTNTVDDAESLPDYTVGPWQGIPLDEAGIYTGRLVVYAPAPASGLRFAAPSTVEVLGADGQVWALGTRVELRPGEEKIIEVQYRLPDGFTLLEVEPSARFPAVRWSFGETANDDSRRFVLDLGE